MNIDPKQIKEYIRSLEHQLIFLRSLLEDERRYPPMPIDEREKLMEITDLRFMLNSNQWPQAVEPELICGDDEDSKLQRASNIINEFIRIDLKNKNFIDFGCGEGHVPYIAASLAEVNLSVGYDLTDQNWANFDELDNLKFTTNFQEIKQNKFDVILLNDVLDHCEDPALLLKQIKEIKSDNAKIFVRCHPWTSRHSTHLYKKINKAYMHLIFSEEELYSMGYNQTKTLKITDPINAYKQLFLNAELAIVDQEITTRPIEMFFTMKDSIIRRIKQNFDNVTNFPRDILEIQFIDYLLL